MDFLALLGFLTNSEKSKLFYKNNLEKYIDFDDYIADLDNSFNKENYSNKIEGVYHILLKDLIKISEEIRLKPVYNNGITTYLDINNIAVANPHEFIINYFETHQNWKIVISLAKQIESLF